MKAYFVTGNQKKYEEVKHLFEEGGIEIEWLNEPKPEPADEWDIKVVAEYAAEVLANKHQKPVVVEDTGFFFKAYNHFPGPHSKFVFHSIGYEGLLKLLDGKDRSASFRIVASFCMPGEKPVSFEGVMDGKVTEEVHGDEASSMPFDRIFIPEGQEKAWILSQEEKIKDSHRTVAFKKMVKHLKERGEEEWKTVFSAR